MSPRMGRLLGMVVAVIVLIGCQAQQSPAEAHKVTVLDGGHITFLSTAGGTPQEILGQAGVTLGTADWVLANGLHVPVNGQDAVEASTLQIRRAVPITLISSGSKTVFQSAAPTVGEALAEQGLELYAADIIDPPPSTAILGPLTVTLTPSRELKVTSADGEVPVRSAAKTVGVALAESGMALQGEDYSLPIESAGLPADGQIKIVRVSESILLAQKSIPFDTKYELSAKLELDQQDLLQAGAPGLSVSRVRVRYEDGKETARQTEAQTTVRQPQDRVIGTGTKVVLHTIDTPAGPRKYWRALHVYATSYSPCRSGGTRCYTGTAGGLPVRRGVIGVVRRWWYSMNGLQVYVPDYGLATISDIGGGIPGTPWIDLGFSDADYESWHQWVTIYFLTPVPASILYDLE